MELLLLLPADEHYLADPALDAPLKDQEQGDPGREAEVQAQGLLHEAPELRRLEGTSLTPILTRL